MGTLVFQATLGGSVNLIGPNTASTINFTLPSADGTSGQALATNGTGTLAFSSFATLVSNTFTGSQTLSAGTANGVTYLNGSKVLTSGSAFTFDGTNIAAPGLATFGSAVIGLASANTDFRVVRTLGNSSFYAGVKMSGSGAFFSGYKSDILVIECDPTNETAGSTIQFTVDNDIKATIPSTGGIQSITTISVGAATPSTSGAGITFPATQSASSDANTLDDYEEGTFTPTLTGAGGGSATYGLRNGAYVKVGKLVTVNFWIYGSSVNTLSGALTMNLPFASSGASEYRPSPSIRPNGLVSVTGSIGGYVPSNSTNLILAILNNGSGSADLLASNLPSSAFEIGGSLSYIANV